MDQDKYYFVFFAPSIRFMLWMFERAGKRNANIQEYQFWQQNNQPMMLNSTFKMDQKMD